MSADLRVAVAGGGTGGHVYPALSIAEAITTQRPGTEFLFFGSSGKIESKVIPAKGYRFRSIWISGVRRSLAPSNLLVPLKVIVSFVQAWSALRSFRPHVVIGTGGYVCGPVLMAAVMLEIPTVLHESNSVPGATTRALAKRVDLVLVGYASTTLKLQDARKVETVGTPVRTFAGMPDKRSARRSLGLHEDRFTVFILGGSQGAESINKVVDAQAERIQSEEIQLIWQTGAANLDRYRAKHARSFPGLVLGFIEEMATVYAATDLVVGRAGASTLAELSSLAIPSVLVPYPYAADDHQTTNAKELVEAGASTLIADNALGDKLVDVLVGLKRSPDTMRKMSASARSLSLPDAARVIARMVLDLARR